MEKKKRYIRFTQVQVLVYLSLATLYACMQKKHFGEVNVTMPDKIPVVSDIAVVLFQHCDYKGYSLALTEGEYNLSDLRAHGIENNDLSSLKLADGYRVVFFDKVNFEGASITETADAACLLQDHWNDRVSSLKVMKVEDSY